MTFHSVICTNCVLALAGTVLAIALVCFLAAAVSKQSGRRAFLTGTITGLTVGLMILGPCGLIIFAGWI